MANVGRGSSGVPQGGSLEADLQRMSDPAKARRAAVEANAAQNLQTATSDGEATMRSLNEQAADQVLQQMSLKDLDPVENRSQYMSTLNLRIKEMVKKAKEVEASGTGNVEASNTYTQIADILRSRLRSLQTGDISGAKGEQTGAR